MLRPRRLVPFLFGTGSILAAIGLAAAAGPAATPAHTATAVHAPIPANLTAWGPGPISWDLGPVVTLAEQGDGPNCGNLTVNGEYFGGGGLVEIDLYPAVESGPTKAFVWTDLSGDGAFDNPVTITPPKTNGYTDTWYVEAYEAGGPVAQSNFVPCIS